MSSDENVRVNEKPNIKNKAKTEKFLQIIQITMILYIIFGLVFGILNGAMRSSLEPNIYAIVHTGYLLYEHEGRVLTVLICSICTFFLLKARKANISKNRIRTLWSLNVWMIIIHLVIPYALGFPDISILFMPFPWASGIFQIYGEGKLFTISYQEGLGDSMLLISSLVYFGYQVFVLIGTLLIGRRWHCTFICTMNGCHAESAGDALPLRVLNPKRPKSKAISPRGKKILKALQYFLFILNLGFITIWIVYLISGITLLPLGSLGMLELMKYLLLELFLMCFLWLYVGGRGYCYYCASGTFLGLIARGAGQEITTNLTKCTTCGLCNDACKMSLDIMSCAKAGVPMKDFNCVGCGLCVDACPTHNLAYNTKFLKKWNLSKSSNKNN